MNKTILYWKLRRIFYGNFLYFKVSLMNQVLSVKENFGDLTIKYKEIICTAEIAILLTTTGFCKLPTKNGDRSLYTTCIIKSEKTKY